MLVLSRKRKQQIAIGDGIVVTILEIKGKRITVGIEAPNAVQIRRGELLETSELSNADLDNIDLPNVDFPDVDLPNVDLPNVDLPDAQLNFTNLSLNMHATANTTGETATVLLTD